MICSTTYRAGDALSCVVVLSDLIQTVTTKRVLTRQNTWLWELFLTDWSNIRLTAASAMADVCKYTNVNDINNVQCILTGGWYAQIVSILLCALALIHKVYPFPRWPVGDARLLRFSLFYKDGRVRVWGNATHSERFLLVRVPVSNESHRPTSPFSRLGLPVIYTSDRIENQII